MIVLQEGWKRTAPGDGRVDQNGLHGCGSIVWAEAVVDGLQMRTGIAAALIHAGVPWRDEVFDLPFGASMLRVLPRMMS